MRGSDSEYVLTRTEFEAVIRHLQAFEPLVQEFERQHKSGELHENWQEHWFRLRDFLETEELPESAEAEAEPDGRYCCQIRSAGLVQECDEYKAWYIFAWTGCVAKALTYFEPSATLQGGPCSSMPECGG